MDPTPQSQLKLLIQKGKEQGYLTFAEVNDHLPQDIIDSDQVEDIISMINDMGIKVTIWTHPFFNIESESLQETLPSKTFTDYDDEDKRDYYVKAGQERYHWTVVSPLPMVHWNFQHQSDSPI